MKKFFAIISAFIFCFIALLPQAGYAQPGMLDVTFNSGTGFSPGERVRTISLQPDGKIIVGGIFTSYNGVANHGLARLNTDGSLDVGFNTSADFNLDMSSAYSVAVQADGKILVGGTISQLPGSTRNVLKRLNTDGSTDAGFNTPAEIQSGSDEVRGISVQPDGKILFYAYGLINQIPYSRLYRLNTDGSADASFSGGFISVEPDILMQTFVQSDGKIIIAGSFETVLGIPRYAMARLNADGTLDMAFEVPITDTNSVIGNVLLQPDGKLIITWSGGTTRLNADGSVDAGFINYPQNNFVGSVMQADGKIIVGRIVGNADHIERLNTDGTVDASFYPPNTGNGNTGFDMAIQQDGKIIIGGIQIYDGYAVGGVARILTNSCTSTVAPSINITASPAGSVCPSTPVTFTATITNGGSNPGYQWRLNGADVIAANNATYTSTVLNDGDVVDCILNAHVTCLSFSVDTSNSITASVIPSVTPSVSIALTAGSLPVCAGSALTFSAIPVNGGAAPMYQWKINNVNAGSNSPSFTYSSFNNNDVVSCVLTSNAACASPASVTSNSLTVTVNTNIIAWYLDADGDGYAASSVFACSTGSPGAGYTSTVIPVGDCNDNNAAIHQEFLFYIDADHDGYGNFNTAFVCAVDANTPPLGYSLTSGDCNDNDATVWQQAYLYYDGDGDGYWGSADYICYGNTLPAGYTLTTLGNDCNDNDNTVWQSVTFYRDNDGDGYGNYGDVIPACVGSTLTVPTGYITNPLGNDCNDNDNTLWQGGLFYIDNDEDGFYGSTQSGCFGATLPLHWYHYDGTRFQDCNDNDNTILGGTLYYADVDGDGYGNTNASSYICGIDHTGYVLDNSDCDDNNPNIHPGAVDICNNGIDEDCNGVADDQPITYYADTDGDGYGDPLVTLQTCDANHPGYVSNNGDCNDADAVVHPGAAEIFGNGIDDNCDGLIDTRKLFRDSDNDGYGDPAVSRTDFFYPGNYDGYWYVTDSTDCDDTHSTVHPGAQELCDGLDNDCNGIVDDNVQPTYAYIDRDGDGYTDFSLYQLVTCNAGSFTPPSGYVLNNGGGADCNDNNAAVNPGAIENLTNGIDDNCDGLIDVVPNNCNWNGFVSSNWQDPANWDCNQVPTGITIVNVPVVTNQPQLTADASVFKLISIYGATIDLNGHTLSMNGESSYGAVFKGSPTSSLVYQNAGSGSILMDQSNDGISNTLANLTYNYTFGGFGVMQLLNKLIITNSIVPTKGRLYTYSGDLVLSSTATKTASITEGDAAGNYITGPVTVERYIPNNNFRSWRLLSVPTYGTGQTIRQAWQEGDVNPNPLSNNLPGYGTQITGTGTLAAVQAAGFDNVTQKPAMLYWNGAGWGGVSNTNNAIDDKKAYFLYIRGERSKGITGAIDNSSATTLRTRGNVYTGDQVINAGANGFTLIPNLYPSAIDFTGLTRTGGVSNLFYIWDSKKQNGTSLGVYQTFSSTNSFNCLINGGSYVLGQPNTMIESGQAFFAQTDNSSGTLTLKESSKRAGGNGLGLRPATPSSIIKLDSRLLNADGTVMKDANAVVFDAAYSNAFDGDDALKLSNPGENFAIEKDAKIMAIEGRQPVNSSDSIQFRMWNLQQQSYRLEFIAGNINTAGLIAVLEDAYLKTNTTLDLAGTAIVNFTVDANAASAAANRFRIVFTQSGPLPVSFISIAATKQNSDIRVEWKVAGERGIQHYEVERSADGRSFITAGTVTAQGNTNNDLTYNWLDATTLTGTVFYRIKSIGINGEIKYSSIVKVMMGNVKPSITISPNPVEGSIINLQFSNEAKGRYAIRLLSAAGQAVFSKIIEHAGGSSNHIINLPTLISRGAYQLEIIDTNKEKQVQTLLINSK